MPNDLSIRSFEPAASTGIAAVAAPGVAGAAATPAAAPNIGGRLGPSPVSHLDPSLGLVVLEFLDMHGTVTSSIPTQKQLDAFRLTQETHPPKAEGTVTTG